MSKVIIACDGEVLFSGDAPVPQLLENICIPSKGQINLYRVNEVRHFYIEVDTFADEIDSPVYDHTEIGVVKL